MPDCFKASIIIPAPPQKNQGLSVIIRSFERLHYLASDPSQTHYRTACSSPTEPPGLETIQGKTPALHFVFRHLDSAGTDARIPFVDSAFDTVIPAQLQDKLSLLNVPDSTCRWVTDVKMGKLQRSTPRLRPSSLCSSTCTPTTVPPVISLKLVDETTFTELLFGGDETAYRWETDRVVTWCSQNNFGVEMVVYFRNNTPPSNHPCSTPQHSGVLLILRDNSNVPLSKKKKSTAEDVLPAAAGNL